MFLHRNSWALHSMRSIPTAKPKRILRNHEIVLTRDVPDDGIVLYEFALCRSIEPEAHPPLAENSELLSELLSNRQIFNYVF